ncbi:hypothetical protein L1887_18397 [Cichorium endivia]|nr:hypothetical protein L1887_18397 [Cichorium endivia]
MPSITVFFQPLRTAEVLAECGCKETMEEEHTKIEQVLATSLRSRMGDTGISEFTNIVIIEELEGFDNENWGRPEGLIKEIDERGSWR